jgi:RNA polymerase sigma factor (sigma-70 family)
MAIARQEPPSVPPGPAQFPPTLWSLVLRAGAAPSDQSERALAMLCNTYWYPIYAWIRRQGRAPQDAEDLTQSFFVHLIEGHKLGKVRPDRGRFRSFLRGSLRNFLADEWSKSQAKKRGGGFPLVSLDAAQAESRYHLEPADPLDPEKIFERRWALTLLDRVLTRLEAEWGDRQRKERFEQLRAYLLGDPDAESYDAVARRLGLTVSAVKVAVLRMRQRYRELFEEVVAETVADPGEVQEEMRHLLTVLGR